MSGIAGAIETQVAVRDPQAVSADDFMPVFTVQKAVERKQMMNQFIGQVLREGDDYGKLGSGARDEKVLKKPGAEKLCSIFGFSPKYVEDKIEEDWTGTDHGGEPLFYYSYRCQLWRGGKFMGEAIGSCNSWESKYRYRWIDEDIAKQRSDFGSLLKRGGIATKFEPHWKLERRETTGQYAKPESYWQAFDDAVRDGTAKRVERTLRNKKESGLEITINQVQYRVGNPEIADVVNTCQKMAQKRALVAVVLVVTNCSDAFTQDIEDFEDHAPQQIATAHEPAPAERAADATAEAKVETKPEDPKNRPIPVPILALYERVVKNRGMFGKACEELADRMIVKAGKAGEDAYAEVAAKFNKLYPKGTNDLNVLKGMLIDLYEAGEALQSTDTAALADLPRPFGGQ